MLQSSRSEVSLGGLQEAADLGEICVEQDQILTDVKMKAQASDASMKMQTEEIESLKKQTQVIGVLLRQLLNNIGKANVFRRHLLVSSQLLVVLVCEYYGLSLVCSVSRPALLVTSEMSYLLLCELLRII
jgi:hypothetical protein